MTFVENITNTLSLLALKVLLSRISSTGEIDIHSETANTLMCLSIGTPKNNKFSICSKWKIYYF